MADIGISSRVMSVRAVLGARYELEFYQRDYVWHAKEDHKAQPHSDAEILLHDILEAFEGHYRPGHDSTDVESYPEYFLGTIIVGDTGAERLALIDGQQRLTTLLALIAVMRKRLAEGGNTSRTAERLEEYLNRRQGYPLYTLGKGGDPHRSAFDDYLGRESHERLEPTAKTSADGIKAALEALEKAWSEAAEQDRDSEILIIEYVLSRVVMCRIRAPAERDAYQLFDTMNARGTHLTPPELLRSHVLSKLADDDRDDARYMWDEALLPGDSLLSSIKRERQTVPTNQEYGRACLQAVLRGRVASNNGQRRGRTCTYMDIGVREHVWMHSHMEGEGWSADDAYRLIHDVLPAYGKWYGRIVELTTSYAECADSAFVVGAGKPRPGRLGLRSILTALALAGVGNGTDEVAERRINAVARLLETVAARRIWAEKEVTHTAMLNIVLNHGWIERLRANTRPLGPTLMAMLTDDDVDPQGTFADAPRITPRSTGRTRLMLARLTEHVERKCGLPTDLKALLTATGAAGHEIDHLIAAQHAQGKKEPLRERIGAVVLVSRSKNKTLGSKRYAERRDAYLNESKLAATLADPVAGESAQVRRIRDRYGLGPEPKVDEAMVERREDAYRRIAREVWSPERLAGTP